MRQDDILIDQHAVEPFLKNGYVLACPRTRQAIYIDPGEEAPVLLERIQAHKLQLIAIVNTHAHIDHICGIQAVKERSDVPIYLHEQDEPLYNALPAQGEWFGLSYPPAPPVDAHLVENEDLEVGDLKVSVHHTPGHSPGSVCLEVDRHVFCGDLIFAGSVGRTDLPGGSHEILIESIRKKLLPLGDEKILHPGHGPETTIGRERKTNPFLTGSVYLG